MTFSEQQTLSPCASRRFLGAGLRSFLLLFSTAVTSFQHMMVPSPTTSPACYLPLERVSACQAHQQTPAWGGASHETGALVFVE